MNTAKADAALVRHFAVYDRAMTYAQKRARLTGERQFVCHRLGYRWYVMGPDVARTARGNANWPGAKLAA